MNQNHVQWCRNLFDTLCDGGVWGVPGCGLIFRKIGTDLVLIEHMPHTDGMPCSAEELQLAQNEMFDNVQQHFKAAGVEVRRTQ